MAKPWELQVWRIPMDSLIAIAIANDATLAFEAWGIGQRRLGSCSFAAGAKPSGPIRLSHPGLCHCLSVRTPEEGTCQIDDLIEVRFE